MSTTRHYGASQAPTAAQRDQLRVLRGRHRLPAPGTSASTARMLTTIDRIVDAGEGIGYEVNKLADWVRRFPLRASEQPEPGWENHTATYKTAVAEAVLMHGWTPERTAIEYGTTTPTVHAIVAAFRQQNRRSNR